MSLKSDFIYLTKCGADNIAPVNYTAGEKEQLAVLKMAEKHMLGALVATAMEKSGCVTGASAEKCRQLKTQALRREMIFERRRNEVFSRMEKAGIWYVRLKGCVLKDFYPRYALREMSDTDVLFDSKRRKDLKQIMINLGFDAYEYNAYIHDVYRKQPVLDFEMHVTLFDSDVGESIVNYYQNIENKLISDGTRRKFSDEDFYVYIVTHIFRHINATDTGLRSLVDLYLYLKAKNDTMNWAYINTQFEILQLTAFESRLKKLALTLFGDAKQLTEEEREYLNQFLDYGAYGSTNRWVEKSMDRSGGDGSVQSKIHLIMHRLFRDKSWWNTCYPITKKYPFIIPFFCIQRIMRGVFKKTKETLNELILICKL